MQVNAAVLLVLDGPATAETSKVVSMELGDASIEAHMQADRLQVTCSVQDISAHDLCTHGAGVSEVLLARTYPGAFSSS